MKFIKQTTNEIVVGISWRQWIDDWYVGRFIASNASPLGVRIAWLAGWLAVWGRSHQTHHNERDTELRAEVMRSA